MARIIDADNTVRTICGYYCGCERDECGSDEPCEAVAFIEDAPTISPDEVRGVGKWEQKEVFSLDDTTIEQMQSARCSSCGKYHTTPFSYYFSKYNYCPNCGAKMEVSEDA